MFYEANRNGTVSEGQSFTDFNEEAEIITFIRRLGWEVDIQERGRGGYYFLRLSFEERWYNAHIYLKKLTPGGRERYPLEKRYQFSGNVDRRGFDAPYDEHTLKAILSIYGNENYEERIICGWNIEEWGRNAGNAFNCLINVDAIADAFVCGMRKHISAKSQTSYAFKPEFLIYYLFNSNELYRSNDVSPSELPPQALPNIPLNKILFGAPGTGKSSKIKNAYAKGHIARRITFHPDYEYGSFVGTYKPISVEIEGTGRKEVHYEYVPQEFTRIYCDAWDNPDKAYFLVIEEINRGNCAQIFGDIFQSLDRDEFGFSEYDVDTDTDLSSYLEAFFQQYPIAAGRLSEQLIKRGCPANAYNKIILPNNLYLYATMNTSDQSLFPMDSAFKRRWDWEYIPIDLEPRVNPDDSEPIQITIELPNGNYQWSDFLRQVNNRIYKAKESEDKQLGFWFVKAKDGRISADDFIAKVLFYLWYEVFRNEPEYSIFPTKEQLKEFTPTTADDFHYGLLFDKELRDQFLGKIMENLGVDAEPTRE